MLLGITVYGCTDYKKMINKVLRKALPHNLNRRGVA
jgi:hypothetical protein